MGIRYGITATFACNQKCRFCNRGLNLLPWQQPSQLSVEDVKTAGRIVREAGIELDKVRLTGGEPTLHPQLREICQAVMEHWKPKHTLVVMTNHVLQGPKLEGVNAHYSWDQPATKESLHRPWLISSSDLGLEPVVGFNGKECWVQHGCGRSFDTFGFSFCVLAGPLGRLLRIDPYDAQPIMRGKREICQHCICSLPRKKQWWIWGESGAGRMDQITKTFREGVERYQEEPYKFKTWKERCDAGNNSQSDERGQAGDTKVGQEVGVES
jgi:hypothetical protein